VLVALFVTLIPTTIGGLLSAIGIAGMDRLVRFNVIAMSGRAVEAAGDVDTLLLDKTGTITFGNRMATEFMPVPGVTPKELAEAAQLASPRRRDARGPLDRRAGKATTACAPRHAELTPVRPLHRADPHERRRSRTARPSARARSTRSCAPVARPRTGAGAPERLPRRRSLDGSPVRRHAARGGRGRPPARRRPPQGHRQAGIRERFAELRAWASAP
jgi:K+-transporting ATPase ATPase B chain